MEGHVAALENAAKEPNYTELLQAYHSLSEAYQMIAARMAEIENKNAIMSTVPTSRELDASLFDSGHTAWMLTSCALVLFMTIPGLILFYGGIARTKNVLSIAMQIFTITCLITVCWLAFGYSLAFGPVSQNDGRTVVIGTERRFWLVGMGTHTNHQLQTSIPEPVFCMYQLTFAIITPALITGAFADRMKFEAMMVFMVLWHIIVYCPIAHSTWHPDGFLFLGRVYDFAGGGVVHISSGVSGLVCAMYLGARKGYGKEPFESHNILLTCVGASMLWVGWFGFNAGSELAADGRAAFAMLSTQIATATAALTWMFTEWYFVGQPKFTGLISGSIAGLVAITPACGFVDQTGAFIIGFLAGPICYGGAQIKHKLGYDDALDAFGVHAIGGMFGGVATGFFANEHIMSYTPVNEMGGVFYSRMWQGGRQFGRQLYAIVIDIGWSAFATFFILLLVDKLCGGVRVPEWHEDEGLDASIHGESLVATTAKFGETGDAKLQVKEIPISSGSGKESKVVPMEVLQTEDV